MSDFYLVRHGGAGLNFSVVGNPKPANPRENTLWINTDAEITGYVFDTEQPTLSEGEVYIFTAKNEYTKFNALKKNRLMVSPSSCVQKVGGVLQAKTAAIFKGGKWVDWIYYIYNNGVENVEMFTVSSQGSADKLSDRIRLSAYTYAPGEDTTSVSYAYTNKIELRKGSLIVKYANGKSGAWVSGQLVLATSSNNTPSLNYNGGVSNELARNVVDLKNGGASKGELKIPIASPYTASVLVGVTNDSIGAGNERTTDADILEIIN